MKKFILVIALCLLNWFIVMPKSFTPARTTIHESYGLGVICQTERDMKLRNLKLWENGLGIFTAMILLLTLYSGGTNLYHHYQNKE